MKLGWLLLAAFLLAGVSALHEQGQSRLERRTEVRSQLAALLARARAGSPADEVLEMMEYLERGVLDEMKGANLTFSRQHPQCTLDAAKLLKQAEETETRRKALVAERRSEEQLEASVRATSASTTARRKAAQAATEDAKQRIAAGTARRAADKVAAERTAAESEAVLQLLRDVKSQVSGGADGDDGDAEDGDGSGGDVDVAAVLLQLDAVRGLRARAAAALSAAAVDDGDSVSSAAALQRVHSVINKLLEEFDTQAMQAAEAEKAAAGKWQQETLPSLQKLQAASEKTTADLQAREIVLAGSIASHVRRVAQLQGELDTIVALQKTTAAQHKEKRAACASLQATFSARMSEWKDELATIGEGRQFVVKQLDGKLARAAAALNYKWQALPFGDCSVRCGGGRRERVVECVTTLGTIVPDALCDLASRPTDFQACALQPCSVAHALHGELQLPVVSADAPRCVEVAFPVAFKDDVDSVRVFVTVTHAAAPSSKPRHAPVLAWVEATTLHSFRTCARGLPGAGASDRDLRIHWFAFEASQFTQADSKTVNARADGLPVCEHVVFRTGFAQPPLVHAAVSLRSSVAGSMHAAATSWLHAVTNEGFVLCVAVEPSEGDGDGDGDDAATAVRVDWMAFAPSQLPTDSGSAAQPRLGACTRIPFTSDWATAPEVQLTMAFPNADADNSNAATSPAAAAWVERITPHAFHACSSALPEEDSEDATAAPQLNWFAVPAHYELVQPDGDGEQLVAADGDDGDDADGDSGDDGAPFGDEADDDAGDDGSDDDSDDDDGDADGIGIDALEVLNADVAADEEDVLRAIAKSDRLTHVPLVDIE
eukprot:PLAT4717.1.p2 GENE.PLAT4717.1~~PLAT4717.1.p2  ORF type:complete len:841 (-),score=502.42 PLAT4717.1:77-2569(-)